MTSPAIALKNFQIEYPDKKFLGSKEKSPALSTLDTVLDQFSEAGGTSKVLKVGRGAMLLAAKVPGSLPLNSELVNSISFLGDTFEFLDIIKSTKEFISPPEALNVKPKNPTKNPEAEDARIKRDKTLRVLHRVAKGMGIVTAGMTGLKLLDRFGAFRLADITTKLGTIPVIGPAVPSFGTVLNSLQVAKAGVEIAISSIKLVGLEAQATRAEEKQRFWHYTDENDNFVPANANLLTEKKQRIQEKMKCLHDAFFESNLQNEYEVAFESYKNAKKTWEEKTLVNYKSVEEAWSKGETDENKLALSKAAKTLDKVTTKMKDFKTRHEDLSKKASALHELKKSKHDTDEKIEQKDKLQETYWTAKLNKWTVKAKHITLDKIKEGMSIATHIVLVIALIASIVIAAVGLQLLVVAISLAALFLLYSASSLATFFTKKIIDKQKALDKVPEARIPQAA